MLEVNKIKTQEQMNELYQVLEKVKECEAIISLRKYDNLSDGRKVEEELDSVKAEVQTLIWIDNRGFLNLALKSGDAGTLKRIQAMRETAGVRNHEQYKNGKLDDYFLFVDLVKSELEVNKVFILSMIQPLFASFEESSGIGNTQLVFTLDCVSYEVAKVTLEEVEYAIEEQVMNDIEKIKDIEKEESFNENEGFINNDDFIDSEKLLVNGEEE